MNTQKNQFQSLHLEGLQYGNWEQRLLKIKDLCDLSQEEVNILSGKTPFLLDQAQHWIENVIGYFPLPMGIANYFVIDGQEKLIPMVVEETSIIAAASATAKWIKKKGELKTFLKGNLIIGQIQMPWMDDIELAKEKLNQHRHELIEFCNQSLASLVARGGGVKEIIFRVLEDELSLNEKPMSSQKMLVLHILLDPCDAMGANIITQVCERLKPKIQSLTSKKVGLCIVSNLVDTKLVSAEVKIKDVDFDMGVGIEEATHFAGIDPYRAATHNKGIFNGIDPILIATGNDWRAIEAGGHAYAARNGKYQPLTQWKFNQDQLELVGKIELPIAVGTVGGIIQIHPSTQIALKILNVQHSEELARIIAAVGLVQNLGALRTLSTSGIVQGHMGLHVSNLAIAAGAQIHELPLVKEKLIEILKTEKNIYLNHAKKILEEIRASKNKEIL